MGASVFFGTTDQTLVTSRVAVGWIGRRWGYSGGANFSFGQSTEDAGDTFVNKRSWNVTSTGEYMGFGRVSPTVSGRLVSSLEKRIDLRVAFGAGVSLAAVRSGFHPELSTFDDLPFTSENTFAFQLTEVVSLKLTFTDNYDSEAVSRGAETNDDGQIVFSVLSSF